MNRSEARAPAPAPVLAYDIDMPVRPPRDWGVSEYAAGIPAPAPAREPLRRPNLVAALAAVLVLAALIGTAALMAGCADRGVAYDDPVAYHVCEAHRTDPEVRKVALSAQWRRICAHD